MSRTVRRLALLGGAAVLALGLVVGLVVARSAEPSASASDRASALEAAARADVTAAHERVGGDAGRLGEPVTDVRCGLLESACVQRFDGGAVYANGRAQSRVEIAYGDPDVAALAAAAQSQVGYVEPSWRRSKWNQWVGNQRAWCGIFQSWASLASGNDDAVPMHRDFPSLVAATQDDTARLSQVPAVGALAFMDLEDAGRPTHVGLVVAHDGTDVTLVEGNVGPSDGRAVVRTTRTDPPIT
ncbi:hypothetical protein ACI6PP_19900, partial [Solicola sp. PLA-1-18]